MPGGFAKNRLNKGFLLVEALISITILIMVSVTGISLLILGQQAINFNEHSLEASLLSQEGVYSIRGLRDTNWLRNGYDKATCWKMINSDCTSPITTTFYRIDVAQTGAPTLTEGKKLDISDGISTDDEYYQLYYQDLDSDLDVTERFVGHDSGELTSPFYRMVEITSSTADHVEGVVRVAWLESGKAKEISLPFTLTNYLLET
ncbi:hypothetical protein ACFL3C_04485 [Patescibacteria group bacterium]